MSTPAQHAYRFRSAEQWRACLFDRVDPACFDAQQRIRPRAPFMPAAELYPSSGAHAPVAMREGETIWRDDDDCLHRFTECDGYTRVQTAPYAIARASRLVANAAGLWVIADAGQSLLRYEADSLTRLDVVRLDRRVIDIAGDHAGGIVALVEDEGSPQAIRIDCAGRVVGTVRFDGIATARAFVFLPRAKRFVVWVDDVQPHLDWFAADGGSAVASAILARVHPCFRPSMLGGDGDSRVFVGGEEEASASVKAFVLTFDGDGETLEEIAIDARDSPITGVAGARDSLLVAGRRGLLRYRIAESVPDRTPEIRCTVITPVLQSPDREDARRWLRIEAVADLPEGSSIEISYAATADPATRHRLDAIARDTKQTAGQRAQRLLCEPGVWSAPIVLHADRTSAGGFAAPLSAPLFDVREPCVWVCISLGATGGGALPSLAELAVLYPGQSLMENLPAIYRRAQAQPGSFLRALVGVLESTTQQIDERIGSLASRIQPGMASGPWLDFVASWLGLPWDDALSEEQKRRIVMRAAELARSRGTRAGLETLLECLLPGSPPRFRVIDPTADSGFAVVGGADHPGSRLPALLGGRSRWSGELDSSAVLGHMRLPCANETDDGVRHLVGKVRVDVAATSAERSAWQPWLPALVEAMVPVCAQARLRWTGPDALREMTLDGSFVLQGPPMARLGADAVIGMTRLPERGGRIDSTGADIGTRLD
ncbi:phage tail protein domain-containing protein [Paraburkholderia steynii]|uniref:Phage tail protein domain-containing protein n=1 Tax=Paraburkholderia steynii TaxID=1245441 RepID=A0A7Z7FM54_9BURK|nr:phage tail protein [Paraburkholderia steynii]SDJ22058.1 phage tail protein domain-containing protein [Paraburkholderia steynii]